MANISVKDGVICIECKNDLTVEIHPDDSVTLSFSYWDGISDDEDIAEISLDIGVKIDQENYNCDITLDGHSYHDLIAALIEKKGWKK